MRFAYADPPYPGTARRHYRDQADYAGEVNYVELLDRLYHDFPDGWALSTSVRGLWTLIPLIPLRWKCRVGAWVKPFSGRPGDIARRRPAYAWEPVIWRGGRPLPPATFRPDWVAANNMAAAPGHKACNQHGGFRTQFPGAKPDDFCYWLFELLNMQPGDELDDLFPGTGRVMRAWEHYQRAGVALYERLYQGDFVEGAPR